MPLPGIPNVVPENVLNETVESADDIHCPNCGFDTQAAILDPQRAHSEGWLIAVEEPEGTVFMQAGGVVLYAYYFSCPQCQTLFSCEMESGFVGGMP